MTTGSVVLFALNWSAVLTPDALRLLLGGLLVTLLLALASGALAFGLAIGIELCYLTRPRTRPALTVYTTVFRGVPALLWVLFFAFAMPMLVPEQPRVTLLFDNAASQFVQAATGIHPYYFLALVLALSLNTSAYLADIVRAGLASVPPGQAEAGMALGLRRATVLHRVQLPQALIIGSPALLGRLIHNLKNTSLAIFLPVADLFSAVQTGASRTFRATEFLLVGAVIYLALAWTASVASSRLVRHYARWVPGTLIEYDPRP